MLTLAEQKLIKKEFGGKYTGVIIPFLTKKKIFNANGQEFSAPSIVNIVTRKRENLPAELAIMQLVKITQSAKIKAAEKRKQLTAKK